MLGVVGCLAPEVLAYEGVIPPERGIVGVTCATYRCRQLFTLRMCVHNCGQFKGHNLSCIVPKITYKIQEKCSPVGWPSLRGAHQTLYAIVQPTRSCQRIQ